MSKTGKQSEPSEETGLPRREFVDRLLAWFAVARRPLPWRESYDPYSVWISEIMLQQTQMERGVAYFNRWMERFPDILAVARADEEAILAAWEGLGYYSRARNLHAAAKTIAERYGGVFPDDPEAIRALPGVGEYTAGAIASIAFDLPVPAVDANVMRIFARILDIDLPVASKEAKNTITTVAASLLPLASPRLTNQALMELGALICGKSPRCDACPEAALCLALRNGTVAERPAGKTATKYTTLNTVALVAVDNDRTFIRKRPPGGLWPGLWEFPGGAVEPGETAGDAAARLLARTFGPAAALEREIGTVRHGYTTNRVILRGFLCRPGVAPEERDGVWAPVGELSDYAFASGDRKLLERLGWK